MGTPLFIAMCTVITVLLGFGVAFVVERASESEIRQWKREREKQISAQAIGHFRQIDLEFGNNRPERDARLAGAVCVYLLVAGHTDVAEEYERLLTTPPLAGTG